MGGANLSPPEPNTLAPASRTPTQVLGLVACRCAPSATPLLTTAPFVNCYRCSAHGSHPPHSTCLLSSCGRCSLWRLTWMQMLGEGSSRGSLIRYCPSGHRILGCGVRYNPFSSLVLGNGFWGLEQEVFL